MSFSQAFHTNFANRTQVISGLRITQLAIIEDFNLLILIADRALIAYHLDTIISSTGTIIAASTTSTSTSHRKAPQKLSGSKGVSFFAIGRMKDRTLVFYKTGTTMSSTSSFKILEPVLHRVAEKSRSRSFLSRSIGGTLDSFRDYDEFYIPAESTGLEIFNNTLAVATAKGFEVLNLDKKTPFSVPDLKQRDVAVIARRLDTAGLPRAMFRLSDSEFLCVYEQCAVYVNKHADINRSVVMEFVGQAKSASLVSGAGSERFLVLFDDDFVEVRDAASGRLKQIISGRDVRCLDDGMGGGQQQQQQQSAGAVGATQGLGFGLGGLGTFGAGGAALPGRGGKGTIRFALQHPELERVQIIVEMVLG